MKTKDIQTAVLNGEILAVGTFVMGKLNKLNIRDKKTGQARESHQATETIITGNGAVVVQRWLKDDEKPEAWKPSAEKGKQVVVKIENLEKEFNGVLTLRGTVELLSE